MKYSMLFGAILMLTASCASTAKFPVSTVVPAAEITATKKVDKNSNYVITLKAKNLANPERLSPPRNTYNVWFVSSSNETRNVGQLDSRNAKSASLEVVSPFDVTVVFITAENEGDLTYPMGPEISRTTF